MKRRIGDEFVRELLSRGKYVFTRDEASNILQRDGAALTSILKRLEASDWVCQVTRGFYCAVPPQQKHAGNLPAEWFIDALAGFFGVEYYVAGLTAALFHGASHQKPQVFQVVVDRQLRRIRDRNTAIDFFYRNPVPAEFWEQQKTVTGYFRLSAPEVVACDLLAYRRMCGSLDLVATVLVELGEKLSPDRLAAMASFYETPVLQRAGWLLDFAGWRVKTDELHSLLCRRKVVWQVLCPGLSRNGARDTRWKLLINSRVEPDLEPVSDEKEGKE